jgi:PPM family protein phosphatase
VDEITAEYTVPELVALTPLRVRPRVTVAAKTDMGRVRENNEDKHEFFLPESTDSLASRGLVFVVCDGMGGHEAGQIASELATKTFLDNYLNHPGTDPAAAMRSAIQAANRFVHDVSITVPSRRGMGTTITTLALIQDRIVVGQVGDSRLYRWRPDSFVSITTDHTWVEEAVRQGMPRQEAEAHPYRHVLTRAIGTEAAVLVDVLEDNVQVGDVFMLCSDGLINHVSDERIREILGGFSPAEAAWRLVNDALIDGGTDNCTVIVVRVDALELVE